MQYTRRGVLSVVGGSVVGSASVAAEGPEQGAKDVGIEEAVLDRLSSGEPEKARKMLAEHGVKYSTSRQVLGSPRRGLTPQDTWEKGSAHASVTAFKRRNSHEVYLASLDWHLLDDEHPTPDTSLPKDAAMLSWEDPWSYEPDSVEMSCIDPETSEGIGTNITNRAVTDEPSSAVGGRIADSKRVEEMFGHLRAEFTKQFDAEGIIGGNYTHSWALGGWGAVPGVQLSANGGPVGIALEEPTGIDDWKLPNGDDRLVKL